ncbi:MAG: hypothetical protein JNL45_05040 [Hyphomicrobium sp.]|nr:hypothetical protein [Hyphomicrobium sp.]
MQDDNDEMAMDVPVGPPKPRRGYKAPPEAHQFKKGRSGNPRGRPKGAKGKRQIAEKVLLEKHEVVEGDRKVQRTTLELILLTLRNKSFEGSNRAFKDLEKLAAKYDPQPQTKRVGLLVVPGRLTMESWRELFEAKNDPTQYDPDEE